MSEEDIIKEIKSMLLHSEMFLLDYESDAIQGLLNLYNKEKENIKAIEEYINIECVSKDKIRQEIKELENMNVDGEVFTTAVNFAKKELENLLEE